MILVERNEQLAAIDKLMADCRQGNGKIALVSGPVMSGKTALLHEFALRVNQSDAFLLNAAASQAEQGSPLGVMNQLFGNIPRPADDTARMASPLQSEALGAIVSAPDMHVGQEGVMPVARRLWQVLREMAAERTVVICIDDVAVADTASLQCLMYFVRRMGLARILMVLSERAESRSANPLLQAEFVRHPGHVNIRLTPLTSVGVTSMLATCMDMLSAQRLAPEFSAVSGGNPLLMRALIDDISLFTAGAEPVLIMGEHYSQAVRSCLYRYDSVVLSVARGVAILEQAASPGLISNLFDLPISAVTAAIQTLDLAGILDAGAYRHPVAQAAVLDGLTPEEQSGLHNRAARLLHEAGAGVVTVAQHLLSGDYRGARWVVPVLREAAEQALVEDKIDRCISLLRTAYPACRDEESQVVIRSALARAEWRADPAPVRRFLPELTEAARQDKLTGPDLNAVVTYLLWYGEPGLAAEALDHLRALTETEAAQANRLGQVLAFVYPGAARVPEPVSSGLPLMLVSSNPRNRMLVGVEQVLEEGHLDDPTLMPILAALLALIQANLLDEAASRAGLLLTEASARNAPLWQAVFHSVHGLIAVRQGEPRKARVHAREAFDMLPMESWGVLLGLPLASAVFGATSMGRYDEAERYLRTSVPDVMFDTPCGLYYLQARGHFNLETGRFRAALEDFRAYGELTEEWDMDAPVLLPWRIGIARAYLGLGADAKAQEMAEEQLAQVGPDDSWTRGITLRVMATTCELHRRPVLLRESVDLLQRSDSRLELARTFADLSRAYQDLGRYGQARMLGCRAALLADHCGAEGLKRGLSDSDPEPEAASPQAAGPSTKLSESELRVASLAADGYTNRQISRKLCITVSTVEQHLTRAYRKLGVNRRDDLASAFQAGLPGPPSRQLISVPASHGPR